MQSYTITEFCGQDLSYISTILFNFLLDSLHSKLSLKGGNTTHFTLELMHFAAACTVVPIAEDELMVLLLLPTASLMEGGLGLAAYKTFYANVAFL